MTATPVPGSAPPISIILFRAGEILGLRLASVHNLRFLANQVEVIQQAIEQNSFASAHASFLARYRPVERVRTMPNCFAEVMPGRAERVFRWRRSTIVTERRENDCSAINPSWTPSDAERWRSVSTPSKSPASSAPLPISAIGSCGAFTRSGNGSATVHEISELAARFAAKEATSKALGTGIRGIRWREMEVLANRRGKPVLVLARQRGGACRAIGARRLRCLTYPLTDGCDGVCRRHEARGSGRREFWQHGL